MATAKPLIQNTERWIFIELETPSGVYKNQFPIREDGTGKVWVEVSNESGGSIRAIAEVM